MSNYDLMEFRKYTFKSELDKAIHTLEGILKGIAMDRKIAPVEVQELQNWCAINSCFIDKHPFNEFIPLIEKSLEDGELSEEELEDILWVCNNITSDNVYFDVITSDIQRLQGILHGIMSDNEINDEEIIELRNWLHENDHLSNTYPYDEVYSLIVSVLSDGKIDDIERNTLKVFFSEFIDEKSSRNIDIGQINKLKEEIIIGGICSVCPEIIFENMNFCFTGASTKTTRNKIKDVVENLKGKFENNVTKNTSYLVVGNNGNPCWAFACYGRKVEKAMGLRKNGQSILIIHENDFWDAIEEL